ncbi:hypothetical protein [Bradyrhizobium sacchari]|nr:hypothetical protein [Bradyrhizobium sacchari]
MLRYARNDDLEKEARQMTISVVPSKNRRVGNGRAMIAPSR